MACYMQFEQCMVIDLPSRTYLTSRTMSSSCLAWTLISKRSADSYVVQVSSTIEHCYLPLEQGCYAQMGHRHVSDARVLLALTGCRNEVLAADCEC